MGRTLRGTLGHRGGSDTQSGRGVLSSTGCLLCGVTGMSPLQSILHLQGVCQPWSQTALTLMGLSHD